jgi:uncharacterized protein DUF4339
MPRGRGVSWYAYRDGQRFGPLETRELRADDLVWCPGLGHWTGATDLPLFSSVSNVERFSAPAATPVARYSRDQVAFDRALAPQESETLPGSESVEVARREKRRVGKKSKGPSYLFELGKPFSVTIGAGLLLPSATNAIGYASSPVASLTSSSVAVIGAMIAAISIITLVRKHFGDGRKVWRLSVAYRSGCLVATSTLMLAILFALSAGLASALQGTGYNPFSTEASFEDMRLHFLDTMLNGLTKGFYDLFRQLPHTKLVVADTNFLGPLWSLKIAVYFWAGATICYLGKKLFLPLWNPFGSSTKKRRAQPLDASFSTTDRRIARGDLIASR